MRCWIKSRSASSFVAVALATGLFGCSSVTVGGSAPCGNAQYANARAVLPDTGINGGTEVQVVFVQHDPDLAGELSEMVIQHLWPNTRGVNPETDPRVRLVRDDGRVLLDTLGSRFDQPTGKFDRPTWLVFRWIKDASLRNAFFESLRDQTLWLELWRPDATQPGTRIRLRTESAGITPHAVCL